MPLESTGTDEISTREAPACAKQTKISQETILLSLSSGDGPRFERNPVRGERG